MHPLFIVAIPLVLIGAGTSFNSIGLSFDQPQSSPEQDPTKRLAIERQSFRSFFDRQKSRALKLQKRVGQDAWLWIVLTIGSFIWLYADAVRKAAASKRIALLQTPGLKKARNWPVDDSKRRGNVKYFVKPPRADKKHDLAITELPTKRSRRGS